MVNKVTILGNVGKEPEIKQLENTKVAKFSLATSETYKNKAGEKVTNTEWHNVVIFGKLADVVENYVKKGSKLYIEGKISYRNYEKDGNKVYFTEIIGKSLVMLDNKNDVTKVEKKEAQVVEEFEDIDSDSLPF